MKNKLDPPLSDNKDKPKIPYALLLTIYLFLSMVLSFGICIGIVYLLAQFDLNPFGNIFFFSLLVFGVSFLVVSIALRIFSKWFLKFYSEIRIVFNKVAKGNFDVKISPTKNEYINRSIDDINAMIAELNSVKILRSDFISNFSHEFKTPIVNINGFAELLLQEDLTDEERKEYAQIIYDESKRLSRLSKNTLLLNKLSSQSILQNKTEFSLDEQIRRIIAQFNLNFLEKNLQVEYEADEITYFGDEDLLGQVWINLINNAIKFSNDGEHITILAKIDNKKVTVSVADEGVGMDAQTKEHIFEQYFQGDKSRKTEGNGLGLSIVQRILQLSGGKISVSSAPQKGTTFTVVLPL